MHSARLTVFTALLIAAAALCVPAAAFEQIDDEPEITDRVARFSSLKGDVTIRRAGMDEWEKAVVNLPIVEGDEIATSDDARLEIQFNASTHVRVGANAFFKISTLSDDGIALSIAEGTLAATITKLDTNKTYFEIDAPKTTIAVQRSGRYRIDAGRSGDQEIRVSVFDDGEARVYSNNAGFTLRDGRSAKIYVEGSLAGEWESRNASIDFDEFDQWVSERDAVVRQRLSRSHYGQFYDDDIYGADDLSDHGDWTYTRDYGYVWSPYQRSIAGYSGWSPYRYGHWRWLPAFGWTWVNDEPWGWSTYHYGRWIWYNGRWFWSPYSYYRYSRSWWSPALVIIRVYNNNVCWYPLGYRHRYNNYNRYLVSARNRRPGSTNNIPIPNTSGTVKVDRTHDSPDTSEVGVIAVPLDEFGKTRRVPDRLPGIEARRIKVSEPAAQDELKRLPGMSEIKTRVSKEIRAETPPWSPTDQTARTGAVKREKPEALDTKLRNKIILGDRPVVTGETPRNDEVKQRTRPAIPSTGAVGRPVIQKADPVKTTPQNETPPWQMPEKRTVPPADTQKNREVPPIVVERPRYEPPKQREVPSNRTEPVRVKIPESRAPAPRQEKPQPKPETRSTPPSKSEPPAKKSEPVQRTTKPAERVVKKDS